MKRRRVTPVPVSAPLSASTWSSPSGDGAARGALSGALSEVPGPVGGGARCSDGPMAAPVCIGATAAVDAGSAGSVAADAANSASKRLEEGCWARDETGRWEIRLQELRGSEIVCGLRDDERIWERALVSSGAALVPAVRLLAVGGEFVAVVIDREVHVLSLDAGRLVLPPILISGQPLRVELSGKGLLLVLSRDAALVVWDVPSASCRVRTSLLHVCSPRDVAVFGVRPWSAEPIVRLTDGKLLLYHKDTQAWMSLSAADVLPDLTEPSMSNSGGGYAEACRFEGDVLVAACLGCRAYFEERMGALVSFYARANVVTRLRAWCVALLEEPPPAAAWLRQALVAMGLNGSVVVSEVVLPTLRNFAGTQELQFEASCMLERLGDKGGRSAEAVL